MASAYTRDFMRKALPITLYRPEYESIRLIQCSPPSWMVELALEEKALSYAVMRLSFARGEHRSADMLARNPRGTIPVLCDGDATLWESLAILEYLDLSYPVPPLLGRDTTSRARALNRLHESGELKRLGMELFAYLMRTPEAELDVPQASRLAGAFCAELSWWERYYREAPWAAGNELTMADLSVFTYVATAHHLGLELAGTFPRVHAMFERMRDRPSVHATWPGPWRQGTGPALLAMLAQPRVSSLN